ncbi:MAG: NAD-dependent epimerase/dehydratase family protein, partial [Actinomycetota bacterium]|nr:NAD-dependent epimerase/dehydratase family protein [Actinomycetota bacterium]
MARVVLITGVSRFLGAHLAGLLAADSGIDRVIGIDSQQPRRDDQARLGRTEFVRADIRNPLIAKVIAQAHVDTVVHLPVLGPQGRIAGKLPTKELTVVGTMQLLSACQRSETVNRFVLRSTAAVYGSGPRDPAVFTEDMAAADSSQGGYARDAVEIEGYLRGFARRRSDITATILRFGTIIGPNIDTPLTRYLAMPVVPTSLGFDPRLQLLHDSDAVEVLRRAAVGEHPGVYNVAGEGVVTLSQVARRCGRVRLPVPAPAISWAGAVVRNSGVQDVSAEQAAFLNFGRVLDLTRLRTQFGYEPRYTTAQALESYLRDRAGLPRLTTAAMRIVEAASVSLARAAA